MFDTLLFIHEHKILVRLTSEREEGKNKDWLNRCEGIAVRTLNS